MLVSGHRNRGVLECQDVSGLERIGDWTKKILHVTKKCQTKGGKHDVTESESALNLLCIATFKAIKEADEHAWTQVIIF